LAPDTSAPVPDRLNADAPFWCRTLLGAETAIVTSTVQHWPEEIPILSTMALKQKAAGLECARLTYDLLQAAALPREQSADMIRDALEGYTA
jgi:hypothetical protein